MKWTSFGIVHCYPTFILGFVELIFEIDVPQLFCVCDRIEIADVLKSLKDFMFSQENFFDCENMRLREEV